MLRHTTQGTVFLEALVAVVILSVGLTGMARAFLLGLRAHLRSRDVLIAALLLENLLTGLVAERYWQEDSAGDGLFDDSFDGYRFVMSACDVDGHPALQEIRAVVFGPGRDQDQGVEAVLYLFRRPPEEGGRG